MGWGSLDRGLWPQGLTVLRRLVSSDACALTQKQPCRTEPIVKVPLGLGHLQSSGEYSFSQSSLMEFQCFPSGAVMKGLSEQRREHVLPPSPTTRSEKRGSEEAVGRDGHRSILTPTPGVLACVTVCKQF